MIIESIIADLFLSYVYFIHSDIESNYCFCTPNEHMHFAYDDDLNKYLTDFISLFLWNQTKWNFFLSNINCKYYQNIISN